MFDPWQFVGPYALSTVGYVNLLATEWLAVGPYALSTVGQMNLLATEWIYQPTRN